jgi:hypothetical protein
MADDLELRTQMRRNEFLKRPWALLLRIRLCTLDSQMTATTTTTTVRRGPQRATATRMIHFRITGVLEAMRAEGNGRHIV